MNYMYDDSEYNQVDDIDKGYGDQTDLDNENETNNENEYVDYDEENMIDSDHMESNKSNIQGYANRGKPNGTSLTNLPNGVKDANQRPGSSLSSLSTSSYSSNNVPGHNQQWPNQSAHNGTHMSNTIVSSQYLANLKFLAETS